MAEESKKVVVIATHGPENKELATIPFMMANAALTVDMEAVVILQGSGVLLAQNGVYDHVFAPGLPRWGSPQELPGRRRQAAGLHPVHHRAQDRSVDAHRGRRAHRGAR